MFKGIFWRFAAVKNVDNFTLPFIDVEDLDSIKNYIENDLTTSKPLKIYRHLVVENYAVFYRIEDGNVYVVRILNRLMDYLKILNI